MMRQALALTLLLSTLGATAASRSDPLASLRFLVGNWTCSYHQGSAGVTYKATFGYDMAGNWLRERDEWAGGGSDEALFTYDPTQRAWIVVVVENERTATIFRGVGPDPTHVVYRSVYPKTGMTEVFDRASPTHYTVAFSGTLDGRVMKSTELCVRN
ncbi:MAG TPA: hypothetical protein VGZ06_08870 [Candidatus Cybelea sp.]|jgi:hypothetical protein|nr:hypothetical protein [Candidatus Cybelea sp.]